MRWVFLILLSVLLSYPASTDACVGKILSIGILDRPDQAVMAELLSQMVTERTGTTVKVSSFPDQRALYEAVRQGAVGMLLETPAGASSIVGMPTGPGIDPETAKGELRRRFNLVWLKPWQMSSRVTPLLSNDVLSSLPALPRLVNKLAPVIDDGVVSRLTAAGGADSRRKSVREFLKTRKLI